MDKKGSMIYKHSKFVLDSQSKKVFDENNKELRLTGNAYRMLEFLCKNKSANLTEIGEFFDWVKEYTENHIRQYRYKINTIIGVDVVEYKNGIYSLVGEIKESEKLDRNTDLLQPDDIKSRKSIMEKLKDFKITIIPGIAAIIILFLSFLNWPYGYYTFLRFIITGVAVYYIYCLYLKEKWHTFWFWALVVIGILFNPFIPIILGDKAIWGAIDLVVAAFFLILIIKFRKK